MDGMNDNLIVGPSISTSEGPSEFEASNYISTSEFYNSYASSTPHGSLFWVPNGPEENRLSVIPSRICNNLDFSLHSSVVTCQISGRNFFSSWG
ncbi:hypothetical protein HanPI659440_Chr12g0459411 [Helianthus annuus]|nr:hypothetical protein HanPI659440_Chr12g0459411 [Helianthus annuus]